MMIGVMMTMMMTMMIKSNFYFIILYFYKSLGTYRGFCSKNLSSHKNRIAKIKNSVYNNSVILCSFAAKYRIN